MLSFSDDLLSFFFRAIPIASARIKGTVMAPVVAPDESNEIAKNSGEVNKLRMKIPPYRIVSNLYNG